MRITLFGVLGTLACLLSGIPKARGTNSHLQTFDEYQVAYGDSIENICSPLMTEYLESIKATILPTVDPMDAEKWPVRNDATLTLRKFEMDLDGSVFKTTIAKNENGIIEGETQELSSYSGDSVQTLTFSQKTGKLKGNRLNSRKLEQHQRGLKPGDTAFVVEASKDGHDCGFVQLNPTLKKG